MLYKFIYKRKWCKQAYLQLTAGFLQLRMREYEALKAEVSALQTGVAQDVNINGH